MYVTNSTLVSGNNTEGAERGSPIGSGGRKIQDGGRASTTQQQTRDLYNLGAAAGFAIGGPRADGEIIYELFFHVLRYTVISNRNDTTMFWKLTDFHLRFIYVDCDGNVLTS